VTQALRARRRTIQGAGRPRRGRARPTDTARVPVSTRARVATPFVAGACLRERELDRGSGVVCANHSWSGPGIALSAAHSSDAPSPGETMTSGLFLLAAALSVVVNRFPQFTTNLLKGNNFFLASVPPLCHGAARVETPTREPSAASG